MFEVGSIKIEKPLALAPMEDVTDISYRLLCKELGADILYTEFVNSDGLIRDCKRAKKKALFLEEERPIGVQIYGHNIKSMVEAAKRVNELEPNMIDINGGCWVRKVSSRGAGAGLLRDPLYFERMVREVVSVSDAPVTVKTRLGWDEKSINILDVAKRIEDAGAKALTLHCRVRSQGLSGEADWLWINRVKEVLKIPVILNGGVMMANDVIRAFSQTKADGVMMARGVIGMPWVFLEAKEVLELGFVKTRWSLQMKAELCLRHLEKHIEYKGLERGVTSFRKYYGGYFKEFYGASSLRRELVVMNEVEKIKESIWNFVKNYPKIIAENDLELAFNSQKEGENY